MKLRVSFIILAVVIWCLPLQAQRVELTVTNPSNTPRSNETVVISWAEVSKKLGEQPTALQLADENGKLLPVQLDDLDLDGRPDELAFAADFGPGQVRKFSLEVATGAQQFPARTDAQNYKRINGVLQPVDDDDVAGTGRERRAYRFDGVGWESEVVGYRLYLDERNATDIQGKRIPGLYWKWIGESGVDYQLDAFWGTDVLHVGPALGIGAIGFWVGDSLLKPLTLDRQRTRIVARGPVRAVVRVEYTGWNLGADKVDVISQFTIFAGDRVSEHRVVLQKSTTPRTLVTGIVKNDSGFVFWKPELATLYTLGRQARSGDTLLMALTVDPARVIRKTDDTYNELLLLNLDQGKPLSILVSSYWQGEPGRTWNREEIETFLQSTARRLNEPLKIWIH
jgi:hypothetical protein